MSIYVLVALAAISVETNVETTVPPAPPPPAPVVRTVEVPMPVTPGPKKGVESPPIPKGNPGFWASTVDYPSLALREEREGTAAFRVTVGKDGSVTGCEITTSSGHSDLDEVTCANVTKRAKFHPAQDKKGKITTGTYANRIRWQIPVMASYASSPLRSESYPQAPQPLNLSELQISKEDYPTSALAAGEQGTSKFTLDIDDAGNVQGCSLTTSSGSLALDQQACVVSARWKFQPARDINGKPTFGRTKHNLTWRLPKGTPRVTTAPIRTGFNPFEKAGSFTLTMDFDPQGKMANCALEQKGEFLSMAIAPNFLGRACQEAPKQIIKPFVDAEGKPEARRVIFRMGVEHADAVLPEKAK
ncbi:MAG TPA: energy transducer TonB [Sphingorhabdus lacus]|jgi:TonB family protein|nr:energy transducer TonB [Sphingorhabdus lacus]HPV68404.1 energy transducer TonB [Sphingorhabdus lacus]